MDSHEKTEKLKIKINGNIAVNIKRNTLDRYFRYLL